MTPFSNRVADAFMSSMLGNIETPRGSIAGGNSHEYTASTVAPWTFASANAHLNAAIELSDPSVPTVMFLIVLTTPPSVGFPLRFDSEAVAYQRSP
jgi:hypothetical protein